ncbi:MAG: hypothetical protein J7518_14670 [Nocardioidaceae bacterium]|nr:hypothetical protein [Nocardioidaceae bacterium]
MKTKKAAAVLVVLAALVSGCGSEGPKSSGSGPTTPVEKADPADVAIAKGSLLVLADLPSGWEATTLGDEDEDKKARHHIATCMGVAYEDLYAKSSEATAHSKTFESEDDDEISNNVVVTEDEARAKSIFALISSEKYRACALTEVKAGIKKNIDDDVKLGTISLNEVSFDEYGDETTAFRVTANLETQGTSVEVALDYVAVRVGRAATTVTAQASFSPFGTDELSTYVKIATDRLTAQLS